MKLAGESSGQVILFIPIYVEFMSNLFLFIPTYVLFIFFCVLLWPSYFLCRQEVVLGQRFAVVELMLSFCCHILLLQSRLIFS